MITTTPIKKNVRGFSLSELIVATAIAGLLMSAVLSSFIFFARSTSRLASYVELEAKARSGLEIFARDARAASAISGISEATNRANISTLTFTIVTLSGTSTVTYTLDSSRAVLTRTLNGATSDLIPYIKSLKFTPYKITDPTKSSNLAISNIETTQIQIFVESEKTVGFTNQVTNVILSARFILRNTNRTN